MLMIIKKQLKFKRKITHGESEMAIRDKMITQQEMNTHIFI